MYSANEVREVLEGNMITAIKAFRERTGEGLRESKEAIDALYLELGMKKNKTCPTCNGSGMIPQRARWQLVEF